MRRGLHIRIAGPLLVGGHTAPSGDQDAGTARDDSGQVIVPGSALKGALRQAVRDLLTGEGSQVCEAPWQPCGPENRCGLCRVFGAAGPDRPGLTNNATFPGVDDGLHVGDAVASRAPGSGTRHGVAIDRWTRSATPGRLYRREVAETGGGTPFLAPLSGGLGDAEWELLERSLPLLEGVGNSQSRGYGRILDARFVEAPRPLGGLQRLDRQARGTDRLLVTLTARQPLALGGVAVSGSYRSTQAFISGASLLGAVTAAAQSVGLVEGHQIPGISFSDLHPGTFHGDQPPMLAPRCAMRCKECGTIQDRSLHQAVARELARSHRGQPLPATCSCDGELAPASGPMAARLTSRVVTRIARDPFTRSAAPAHLHAREQVRANTRFGGTCWTDDRGRDLLQALAKVSSELKVGGLRSRGLGAVDVKLEVGPNTIEHRLATYRRNAAERIAGLDLEWDSESLLLVVARSDVAGTPDHIMQACGANARLLASWVRGAQRSGWDAARGSPRAVSGVIAAGSAWLLSAPNADPALLLRAESCGVGHDTILGLGRLSFCPFIQGRQ